MIHSAQISKEHMFHIFQNIQNMEPYFQDQPDFQDPSPKICVLGPGNVLGCPQITSLFTTLTIFYKSALSRDTKMIVCMLLTIWH